MYACCVCVVCMCGRYVCVCVYMCVCLYISDVYTSNVYTYIRTNGLVGTVA